MTSFRVTLALVLVMVVVLLAAGCAGQPAGKPPVNMKTVTESPVPANVTMASVIPVGTTCSVHPNGSSWITLNPTDRIERGEAIRINGTTNVPAGKHLTLYMYSSDIHPHCRCCYDDELAADVIVRSNRGCENTFSLWFDTTNFVPAEYIVTAAYPENNTKSNTLIIEIQENTTPLPAPSGDLPKNTSAGTLLAALRPHDVARGDIQTITGVINGTPYAIEYSVRDAALEPVCRPECPGENYHGILHPLKSNTGLDWFALRFDTTDMKPGSYVADLKLTCIVTDSPLMVFFNVTPDSAGTLQ